MSTPSRRLQWIRKAVMALALIWVATVLVTFARRFGYAMELEWMEGGVLHQALRFSQGEALYPAPGPEFIPFLYTPGYPIVLGVLGWVFPIDFALGRTVSILAAVAAGIALGHAVRKEGKPRAHAVIAVGLFAAGWVFSYRWLDLARPDSLYLALTAWGLVVLRHSRGSHRDAAIAGVLLALAFWTKQTAASFIIAAGLVAVIAAPRQLPTLIATVAVIDGGGVLWGNAATDGQLWAYIYELHQAHAFNRERFTTKTWGMFAHAAPWLTLLAIGLAVRLVSRLRRRLARSTGAATRVGVAYWTVVATAGLLVSALGYSTQWAEPNAFLPGVFFVALWLGVVLPVTPRAETTALALIGAQLAFAYAVEPHYQPIQKDGLAGISRSYRWRNASVAIPTDAQRQRARALREHLRGVDGEVLALHRPWWSVLAGGQGHVGSMGLTDVPPQTRAEVQGALRKRIRERGYAEIWVEGEPPNWLRRELDAHYRVGRRLQGGERVRPMSGWMSVAGTIGPYRRDQVVLVPKGQRERPEGVHVVADFESARLDGFSTSGRAFGRRPVRGKSGKLPLPGPYGGEYLLCSAGRAGRVLDTGEAMSPVIELPEQGALRMLLGSTGRRKGLTAEIVRVGDSTAVRLKIPKGRHRLAPVRWSIPEDWAGAEVQVRLEDASPEAALYFDDLWVEP
ncbi:MAG: hypothetical protein AAF721_23640 [Myxococcota bacterium]